MKSLMAALFFAPSLLVGEEIDEGLERALGGLPPLKPNVATKAVSQAFDGWHEGVRKLEDEFRKDLGKAIELSGEVQVLLLDFNMVKEIPEGEKDAYFPIIPYNSYSKILNAKTLKGEKAAECAKVAAGFVASEDMPGAFCHYPIHGLRFYREGRVIFQTSICWVCGNYYLRYPDEDRAGWAGFKDVKLKAFLDKVMPIPQAELDRFEKWRKGDQ